MVSRMSLRGTTYPILHYFHAKVRKRAPIFLSPISLVITFHVIRQALRSGVDFHNHVIDMTICGFAFSN